MIPRGFIDFLSNKQNNINTHRTRVNNKTICFFNPFTFHYTEGVFLKPSNFNAYESKYPNENISFIEFLNRLTSFFNSMDPKDPNICNTCYFKINSIKEFSIDLDHIIDVGNKNLLNTKRDNAFLKDYLEILSNKIKTLHKKN